MNDQEFNSSAHIDSGPFSQKQVKSINEATFNGAGNLMERDIDLNEKLIKNKQATFFFRMKGDAMSEAGIFDNDILIIDRSLKLTNGKIIVAILNGELLVRRFHKNFSSAFLVPENGRFKNINLAEFTDFIVWGIVTYVIHPV
ncbi:MAG: LexA family protein [Chitinophagaceae bacterium]